VSVTHVTNTELTAFIILAIGVFAVVGGICVTNIILSPTRQAFQKEQSARRKQAHQKKNEDAQRRSIQEQADKNKREKHLRAKGFPITEIGHTGNPMESRPHSSKIFSIQGLRSHPLSNARIIK
jgi:mannitol-specific phosphotransferase system IIBC component